MSKSHWVLVAFVATMVCNGNCRPREVEVKNIYPVYRSEKQLELETQNRYEKLHKEKQDGDSVIYQRIDIPYTHNTTGESVVKNNSKSVIDYIPVALTIKKPNIKKWPSDQNGIESPDDLTLYNIYTSNINPLTQATNPSHEPPFQPPPRPPIFILEELTTRKPSHEYNTVYTQPIQILDRPPPQPPPQIEVRPPLRPPPHIEVRPPPPHIEVTLPPRPLPIEVRPPEYSTTNTPVYNPPPHIEQNQIHPIPQSTTTVHPPAGKPELSSNYVSTWRPETTTKRKNTSCPNVSITASTSINNSNSMNKEGCQDISVHISTNVNNSNGGLAKPNKPATATSGSVVAQNDSNAPSGVFGIFDLVWAIFSRIFNFSIFNHNSGAFSPFSTFVTGISAFFLPWIFPHLLLQAYRGRLLEGFNSSDHVVRSVGRNWASQPGWTVLPTAESEVKSETENVNKTQKLNIESIATVARASGDDPPLPSPTAIGHMIDTVSHLVESDIRTPPKLKEIIKEKANEQRKEALGENSTPLPYTFIYEDDISRHETTDKLLVDSSEGKASNMKMATDEGVKGIAIPVVMDEDYELTAPPKKLQKIPEVPKPGKDDKKKTAVTKSQPTTTPSSGLSTWILLSDNKDVTTPSPKKNNNRKEEEKKKGGVATTTKKPSKVQATTQKSTTQSNKKVTPKPSNKKETQTTGISALEALVKNQKKASTTTPKPKTSDSKKKIPDRLEVAETKDKLEIELPEYKTVYTLPPNLQITTVDDKSVTVSSSQSSSETTTQSSVEGTTKKKTTTKKKKKNKNRRKKPAETTGVEAKIPAQPVGSQIYNFLSREIVPTVGLGLIGVALTAGLASFLGYNPFASSTIPLRRTYDTHHGYSPNNYYNYNTDYGDGGQSEEVLFREVLSGMPEDSRYGLTHSDASYPDSYKRQDQTYDSMKNPAYSSGTGTMYNDKDVGNYDATYPQDYSTGYGSTYDTQDNKYATEVKEKYPVYTRETGTSFVYPETTGMTSAEKASKVGDDYPAQNSAKTNPDTIERQPEALYRVASEGELQYRHGESTIQGVTGQNSWHRIGSPMEAKKSYQMLEPGPRSLDLDKPTDVKKRSKRAAESVIQRISRKRTKKENDVENEVDFDDSFTDSKFSENMLNDISTTTTATKTTTAFAETTTSETVSTTMPSSSTTEDVKEANPTEPTDSYESENDSAAPPAAGVSVLDVLKRLAQFKLRLGLNFLRSTTDLFSRYLDDIQRRVDESFANTTTTTVQYNRRKNPWSRLFFSRLYDDEPYRRKRSVLKDNQFLGAMLTEEDNINERFSKSTKKDLRLSNKVFHQKKTAPKKFESKRTN